MDPEIFADQLKDNVNNEARKSTLNRTLHFLNEFVPRHSLRLDKIVQTRDRIVEIHPDTIADCVAWTLRQMRQCNLWMSTSRIKRTLEVVRLLQSWYRRHRAKRLLQITAVCSHWRRWEETQRSKLAPHVTEPTELMGYASELASVMVPEDWKLHVVKKLWFVKRRAYAMRWRRWHGTVQDRPSQTRTNILALLALSHLAAKEGDERRSPKSIAAGSLSPRKGSRLSHSPGEVDAVEQGLRDLEELRLTLQRPTFVFDTTEVTIDDLLQLAAPHKGDPGGPTIHKVSTAVRSDSTRTLSGTTVSAADLKLIRGDSQRHEPRVPVCANSVAALVHMGSRSVPEMAFSPGGHTARPPQSPAHGQPGVMSPKKRSLGCAGVSPARRRNPSRCSLPTVAGLPSDRPGNGLQPRRPHRAPPAVAGAWPAGRDVPEKAVVGVRRGVARAASEPVAMLAADRCGPPERPGPNRPGGSTGRQDGRDAGQAARQPRLEPRPQGREVGRRQPQRRGSGLHGPQPHSPGHGPTSQCTTRGFAADADGGSPHRELLRLGRRLRER